MSSEPKIGPLPKCPQNCKWSTAWCLTNPYCRTQLLPPRTSSTTLACATCLVATTTSTMQDSLVGSWRWRPMKTAKKGDMLILCLQVEDEWIFFTYPLDCLGIRSDLDLDLRNRRSANLCFLKIQSKWVNFSHHEHDPTGSLEMIPENCPLDPVRCSWS